MGSGLSIFTSCVECDEATGPDESYYNAPPKKKEEQPPPSYRTEDFVVRGDNTEDVGRVTVEQLQGAQPFRVGETPAAQELNRQERVRIARKLKQDQKESDMRCGEFSLILTSMKETREVTVLGHLAERASNAAEGRSPPQPESAQRIGMVGRMLAGLKQ